MSTEVDVSGTVVVVHAHPDDEVFATGASTIAAAAVGAAVHLRIFTGGEGRGCGTTPQELHEARRRKTARLDASARLLGIDTWDYVTEPGHWNDTPDTPEKTIAAASIEELTAPVVEMIDSLQPDVLLTVGRDGLTGHPDHIACHLAVQRALPQATHRPRHVLGAVLDEHSVSKAYDDASAALGRPIGSGKVAGVSLDEQTLTISGPHGTQDRRRRALDEYSSGLGSAGVTDLAARNIGSGDSALLRFVLDISGWGSDHYTPIFPS